VTTILEQYEKDLSPLFEELVRSVQVWTITQACGFHPRFLLSDDDVETWIKTRAAYAILDDIVKPAIDLADVTLHVALRQIWVNEVLNLPEIDSAFLYGVESPANILRKLLQKLGPVAGLIVREWEWGRIQEIEAVQACRTQLSCSLHQAWEKESQRRRWSNLAEAVFFLDPQLGPVESKRLEIAYWLAEQWPLSFGDNLKGKRLLEAIVHERGKEPQALWHDGLFLQSFLLAAGRRQTPQFIRLGKSWVTAEEDGKRIEIQPGELGGYDYVRWIRAQVYREAVETLEDWLSTQIEIEPSEHISYEAHLEKDQEAMARTLHDLFSPEKALEAQQSLAILRRDASDRENEALELLLAGYEPANAAAEMCITRKTFDVLRHRLKIKFSSLS
jgi:hypothetical protein